MWRIWLWFVVCAPAAIAPRANKRIVIVFIAASLGAGCITKRKREAGREATASLLPVRDVPSNLEHSYFRRQANAFPRTGREIPSSHIPGLEDSPSARPEMPAARRRTRRSRSQFSEVALVRADHR